MNFPTGFNAPLASRLCFLSNLAYDCVTGKGKSKNPSGYYCKGNFAYIVRRENGRTLVGFQGSNDIKDFILDISAVIDHPESAPTFPAVHSGFWKAAQALIDHLREELSRWGGPVILGGHSLGGAIAVLMAVLLKEQGHEIEAVYGFGTPPVGAVQFSNYYHRLGLADRTYLTIYRRDAVPFLQPCGISVVTPIFLDERAYQTAKRPDFSWLNPFRWSAWRKDHNCDGYAAALAKIADRVAP